ncbi:MAG: TIGR04141 family sporadically distributed protein [Firmicutes bacterium]|nr:TIGR04141 family sporadically distributed protein [Bacillota bacterium]
MEKEKLKNYEINIYKINNERSLEEYSDYFLSFNKNFVHKGHVIENNVECLYFTYINYSANSEIAWFNEWKEFFSDIQTPLRKESQTGHGLIVIKIDEDNIYAIVFGRAYSLIKDCVISQFGMDMATILFDGKSIDSISSKYFSLNKNKSITSYYGDSTFEFVENEAVDLLKADIVNSKNNKDVDNLLNLCQKKATIGMDNVKLTLHKKVIELKDVIECCQILNRIRLFSPNFPFPRMTQVKGDLIDTLDSKLLDFVLSRDSRINFSVPFYSKDSSDEYVFLNSINDIQLKVNRTKSEVFSSVNDNSIKQFLQENKTNIKSIRDIQIIVDGEQDSFIKWIDEQTEYNGCTYAIVNGKWYTFNQAYIDNINNKIRILEKEKIIKFDVNNDYSFSEQALLTFYNDKKEDIQESFGSSNRAYKEYIYNFYLKNKYNLSIFDRVIFKDNIEVCDLYGNQQLIHCKIGNTSKLEECIRQSIYGTKYYYQNQTEVKEKENKDGVKIDSANKAVVIFLKEIEDNKNFSSFSILNSKSLRLKLTFIDWINMCNQIRIKPEVIVSKYIKN